MKNQLIAEIFYGIADILEMQAVQFKPQAYRKAARSIESLSEDIEDIYNKGGVKALKDIPGVGENIAKKIEEFIKTGKVHHYDELKKSIPKHIADLMEIPGMGPRRIKLLHEKLGISSIKDLEAAARAGRISRLASFGEKSEEDILKGIALVKKGHERMLLGAALPVIREVEGRLKGLGEVNKVVLAGSVRRMKETIGDLDVLVTSKNPGKVMDFFTRMPEVQRIIAKGPTKSTVILKNGLQTDLRVVDDASYGSALQYFTGSKEHSIRLRGIAIKKGLKLSEYGVFNRKTNKRVAGRTEEDFYKALGMSYIEPELRENAGEIELAMRKRLPKIVPYNAIKGDFHVHTRHSDGVDTVEGMALAAKALGYEYICVSDHTKSSRIAHGQSEEQILNEISEIKAVNKRLKGIRVLAGAEVDILPDGSLDIADDVLKKLEIVTASVHSRFKSSKDEMTKRVVRALQNRYVDVLGHPTGRLISRREPYEIDLKSVFEAAKENSVAMEINAMPDRLDLRDIHVKAALEQGLKLAIGTDAHNKEHLRMIELGVATARRGWAQSKDVLNTYSLKQLPKFFKKIRL